MPVVTQSSQFKNLIGLSYIHVLDLSKEGTAYVGFEFGCTWDEEHGLGMMTHKDRVIEIGAADTSFESWIAEKDIDPVKAEEDLQKAKNFIFPIQKSPGGSFGKCKMIPVKTGFSKKCSQIYFQIPIFIQQQM